MTEPYLSQFSQLVRAGASSKDIHDVSCDSGFARASCADDNYVERELSRVDAHRRNLLPLIESVVGRAEAVLDVGCNTGGTTLALALSKTLDPKIVVGVDPNGDALAAARLRAMGHGQDPTRVRFEAIAPNGRLPFADCSFDLTTCVSVLEFVSERTTRHTLTSELQRVTRPGGFIFVATPSPWRLRELHSGRVFGHLRRSEGYPWSSTPADLRQMFRECERVDTDRFVLKHLLTQRGLNGPAPAWLAASRVAPLVAACLPWQKMLVRRAKADA